MLIFLSFSYFRDAELLWDRGENASIVLVNFASITGCEYKLLLVRFIDEGLVPFIL